MNVNDPRRIVELFFEQLHHLTDGQTADGKKALRDNAVTVLDRLHQRVLSVVERDLTGDTTPDGHRASTGGGGRGGGPVVIVKDENGQPDSVPVTSVEQAAFALLEDPIPDPFHVHVEAILGHLEVMVHAKHNLQARLNAIDASDRGVNIRNDPSGFCLVCDRFVEGTANDRLRRGMCRADWMAWKRAGSPPLAGFRRLRNGTAGKGYEEAG